MIERPAHVEPLMVFPIEFCQYMPCISESCVCGYYEGITASGDSVLCSQDDTQEAAGHEANAKECW